MTGQTKPAAQTSGTLRAPPTGNPYAPPVTMMRPQQGYTPRTPTQQAPQANYAYQSQYVAPIQRPQPQWAIPQTYEMPTQIYTGPGQTSDPSAPGYDAAAHQAAMSGWGNG